MRNGMYFNLYKRLSENAQIAERIAREQGAQAAGEYIRGLSEEERNALTQEALELAEDLPLVLIALHSLSFSAS